VRRRRNHGGPLRGKPSGRKPGGAQRKETTAIERRISLTFGFGHVENSMRAMIKGQPQNPKEAKWPFEFIGR
jgi:hypothetical protein